MTHRLHRPLELARPAATAELPETRVITPTGKPSADTTWLWAVVAALGIVVASLAVFTVQGTNDADANNRIEASTRQAQAREYAALEQRASELETQLSVVATRNDELNELLRQVLGQVRELQGRAGIPQRRIVITPPSPKVTRTTAPRTIPIPPARPTPHPEWTPVPSPTPGPSLGICTPLPSCVLPTPLVSVLPGPSAS